MPVTIDKLLGKPLLHNHDQSDVTGLSNTYAPIITPTFTGTVTIPTPFTLGAVSVLPTGTELNYVDGVTSAIQTQIDAKVSNATHTGDATGATALTVVGINGVSMAGLATGILKNTTTTGVPSIAVNSDLPAMSATVGGAVPTPPNNTTTFLRGDGTFATPAGDMVLANAQTNSGAKTFLATTLLLRNVANTFSAVFTNTNTAARIYTLQNRAGTLSDNTDLALKANLASPTFTTSIRTPLIIGGTLVGSNIIYQSTTGIGTLTGIAHRFTGGTNGATVAMTILNNGNVGIGPVSPTAYLHLPASTAAVNTASLKITAGVVATTPVSGNIESDGVNLFWTDAAGTRKQLDN